MSKFIGISGNARVGKDSIAEALLKVINTHSPHLRVMQYAFADELKRELDPFFIEQFGISATKIPNEKKHIYRPLLIAHGQVRRMETENKYWVDKVKEKISYDKPDVVIISDLRYIVGANAEFDWIKNEGGKVIHIKRYNVKQSKARNSDRVINRKYYVKPASDDEKLNDPELEKNADFNINWETVGEDKISKVAEEEMNKFYFKFINYFIG